nr:unnamed protein product [Callosobruchus analis]
MSRLQGSPINNHLSFVLGNILFSLADIIFKLGGSTLIARNIGLATAAFILLVASTEGCIMLIMENSGLVMSLPLAVLSVYVRSYKTKCQLYYRKNKVTSDKNWGMGVEAETKCKKTVYVFSVPQSG